MRRPGSGLLLLLLLLVAIPAYAQAPSNGFTTVWSSLDPGNDWAATIIRNVFPTTTGSGGTFNDIPVGACFASIPPNNACASPITQNFQVIANGATFPITTIATQNECYDTVGVSGTGNPTGKNFSYSLGTP